MEAKAEREAHESIEEFRRENGRAKSPNSLSLPNRVSAVHSRIAGAALAPRPSAASHCGQRASDDPPVLPRLDRHGRVALSFKDVACAAPFQTSRSNATRIIPRALAKNGGRLLSSVTGLRL